MAEKPHLNLAMIGHVDHGKSTLVGRTFYDTGEIDDTVIKKFEEMGDKGKTFKFAWVMDSVKEERERGLTIDLAHRKFETDKYYFTIIDAPGHQDFVKNMITGTSQADAAILVVAADDGIMPQTREHAALAYTLGVSQLVVVINKMDLVDFKEDTYNELKDGLVELLSGIGYKNPENFPYVPTSAFEGDNVVNPSEKMDWFDGPTFISALDSFEVPEKPIDKPLRIPVQDVYSIKGVGTVPVGRVETGKVKSGDELIFMPSGNKAEIKSIEMHHEEIPEAEPGDNIGFNVRGLSRDEIKRGEVASLSSSPATVVEEFTARIAVLQHPTAITAGYTPVFHAHTAQVACEITEIPQKLDPKSGEVIEENPDFIKRGDMAVIKVKPSRPLVIEKASDIPELSRFAIRDMGQTVAAGAVTDLVEKK
ncbi:elongation factor 1-alpha [candidate division MSBL1 archaeon SCGC-AAA261G05]|uniref:Elongation factor 1-alpha n=2 Tax=candidate division MSBL1 TaxID=215777 RepID=A0A133V187_9EURY|nr:elongation factor 1-alpha [candidate division MSBL1 archaeon SCGC-AAA261C02]KXB04191.1 elongation factor 1-alpha [candidate division MSBL1 archaeon SCGC-AAA261G05]